MPTFKVLIVSNTDRNILLFRRPLIEALLEKSVEVHLCVPEGRHGPQLRELGCEIWHYPLARGSLNPARVLPSALAVRGLFSRLQPDVVHSFTHQANILSRMALCGRARLAHTITGLGSGFIQPGPKGTALRAFFNQLYRASGFRCHALVFQNDTDRSYFEKHRLVGRARSLCIKGSGVDTRRFSCGFSAEELQQARATLGFSPDDVVCTMTARLLYNKGVMEFAQAAQRLAHSCPRARFLIVGEADPGNSAALRDEDLETLRRQPNLTLAGWRDDMPLLWCLSDVGVLPSHREGLPMSLQEAMSCGLPVVATDVPGCREVVEDGPHGILTPLGDVDALAKALEALVQDPSRREAMGRASRERAERVFDGRIIARQYITLYEELLAWGRSG